MTAALTGFLGGGYPERDDKPQSKLERAVTAARYFSDRLSTKQTNLKRIVNAVSAYTAGIEALEDEQLLARANGLRPRLRKAGVTDIDLVDEVGIDIRSHKSQHINEFKSTPLDVVVTVCAQGGQYF